MPKAFLPAAWWSGTPARRRSGTAVPSGCRTPSRTPARPPSSTPARSQCCRPGNKVNVVKVNAMVRAVVTSIRVTSDYTRNLALCQLSK